jgi:hypothetical protein
MKRRSNFKGPAHRKKYLRAWYRANKARILAAQKADHDHRLEQDRAWRAAHPDRLAELLQLRRAKETPAQKARRLKKNRASYRARRIRQGFAVMPLKTSR